MDGHKKGFSSEKPPKGHFFYIVTPHPPDKNGRYVRSIERPTDASGPRVLLSSRTLAKPFSSLALCRAYCDFLNRTEGLDDFIVVMEAG
jgi:hypothetical protein